MTVTGVTGATLEMPYAKSAKVLPSSGRPHTGSIVFFVLRSFSGRSPNGVVPFRVATSLTESPPGAKFLGLMKLL